MKAVDEIEVACTRLLMTLETNAPARDRSQGISTRN